MPETTIQEVINKESPQLEAYRLGLLSLAKGVAGSPITLPNQQVASLSPLQTQALQMTQAGLGAYAPYLSAAGNMLQGGTQAFNQLSPIASDLADISQGIPGYS